MEDRPSIVSKCVKTAARGQDPEAAAVIAGFGPRRHTGRVYRYRENGPEQRTFAMNKKQKNLLIRILAAGVCMVILATDIRSCAFCSI